MSENQKVKVIYVVGGGRSGTTILSFIIGSAGEVFNAGELKYFNDIRDMENPTIQAMGNRCSCGADADKCKFWVDIERKLGEKVSLYKPGGILQRLKLALRLLFPLCTAIFNGEENFDDYRLFATILEQARAFNPQVEYVLDVSKSLDRLIALRADRRLDIRVLYIVRDGRGYINAYRNTHGKCFFRWLLQWIVVNLMTRYYLKREKIDYFYLSYEQFCDQPGKYLEEINRLFGISIPVKNYAQAVRKTLFHVRTGNPLKGTINNFKGVVKDQKWQRELPWLHRWLATILIYPFNRWWVYGRK